MTDHNTPFGDQEVPARWNENTHRRAPRGIMRHRVLVEGRERCWNCGHDLFAQRRPTGPVVAIVVVGILLFLIGALLALAVPKRSYCLRCGQHHHLDGNMTIEARVRQA